MSQYDYPVNGQTNGPALGVALPLFRDSIWSSHKGPAAPTYAIAGLSWIDDSGDPLWLRKTYDGTNWITVEALDTTTNIAYPINVSPKQSFPLAGGTANALTLTPAVPTTAYVDGDVGTFRAKFDNTGPATMDESGVGPKELRKIVDGADVPLAAKDLLLGRDYFYRYDAAANSGAGAAILVNSSLIRWNSADQVIEVDSAGTQLFVPIPASTAAGDLEYFTTAKVKARLPKGSAGQQLRMNSEATAPEWAEGWELIGISTPSNAASISWTGLSAFRRLRMSGFLRPASNGVNLFLRTSTNNGGSYDAAAADYAVSRITQQSTGLSGGVAVTTAVYLNSGITAGSGATSGLSFTTHIEQFNQPTWAWMRSTISAVDTTGSAFQEVLSGWRQANTARDALQLLFSSGAIASGHVILEGWRG